MSTHARAHWFLVAVVLAAGGIARADSRAIGLTGRAGGSYLQTSEWATSTAPNSSLFGLNLGLGINGGFFNPRFLRWSASADYDQLRGALFSAASDADRIGFRGNAVLLGGTPFNVALTATRYFTDTSAQSLTQLVGNSVNTVYGVNATLRQEQLPNLRLGLSRLDTTTTLVGLAPTTAGSTRLSAGVSQSLSKFEYGVAYDTNWSDGSFADLNYQSHSLLVNLAAPLSDVVRLNLYDTYYLRSPTVGAATNPRYDTNALGAGIQWRHDERSVSSFDYGYNHSLVEAPSIPLTEQTSHGLTASTRRLVDENVFLLGNLGATAAQTTLGTARSEALGQRLGAGAEWQGRFDWGNALASGVANIGLVEPSTGGVRVVHGVSASGQYNRDWERLGTSLQYMLGYDNGSALVNGWTITQQARLEGSYRIDPKSRVRGLLTAYAGRRDAWPIGVALNRNVSLLVEYLTAVYTAQLSGGFSDGLGDSITNPISDGLFLPANFNSHSRFLTLGGTASFDRGRLNFALNARLAFVEAPGRPSYYDQGFQLLGSYTLGKFIFSVEERFALGGPPENRQQVNIFMVRIVRTFDWQLGT